MQERNMELRQLDNSGFDRLSVKWLDMIKDNQDGVMEAEYTQLFSMIKSTGCWDVKECFNKPIYNCVFDSEDNEWGIVEILQSKKGSSIWIKMMNIYLSPDIEKEDDTEESTKSRLDVFRASLRGIFLLTKDLKNADTVKVYGRTESLVTFLRGMHDTLTVLAALGKIKGIEVSIEGRWLVFHTATNI
jgi:hypothetical protein